MTIETAETADTKKEHLPDMIESAEPNLLAKLLKEDENLTETILTGFRPTARSIGYPIVRKRLAHEAEKDQELMGKLRDVWMDGCRNLWEYVRVSRPEEISKNIDKLIHKHGISAVRTALRLDNRDEVKEIVLKLKGEDYSKTLSDTSKKSSKDIEQTEDKNSEKSSNLVGHDDPDYKTHVKELNSHIRELEKRLNAANTKIECKRDDTKTLRSQLSENKKQLDRLEKMLDRASRARDAAEREKAILRRDLRVAKKQLSEDTKKKQNAQAILESPSSNPEWMHTVSKMIRNKSYDAARSFCETLLEMDADNIHAHIAMEQLCSATGAADKQIKECIWISKHMSRRGQHVHAVAFICRALEIAPTRYATRTELRRILHAMDAKDEEGASGIRRILSRLKLKSKEAHKQAAKIVADLDSKRRKMFMSSNEVFHLDKIFTLSDNGKSVQASTRRIIQAVDCNEVSFIEFVRNALVNLYGENYQIYRNVLKNLENQNLSYVSVVTKPCEAVIVDGSNAAWTGAEKQPRMGNLLGLIRELHYEGYFPVYIYVDASLPFQIDQATVLKKMIDSSVITVVGSRTDADEAVVARAKKLACPIVSNYRMLDWDPNREIKRIKFQIDDAGVTIYDW